MFRSVPAGAEGGGVNVYFIAQGTLIKIGKSACPASRLKQLQTGTGVRLQLLATANVASDAAAYEVERRLHQLFAWSRRRGEFFSSSMPLRQLIAAVASGTDVHSAMALAEKSCRKRTNKSKALIGCKATTPPVLENSAKRRKRIRAELRMSG